MCLEGLSLGDSRNPRKQPGVRSSRYKVYYWPVVRRTNINLDIDLVDQAAAELGTARTTDTVHAALRDVVARARRARLARRDFADLTPDAVEEMRRPSGWAP